MSRLIDPPVKRLRERTQQPPQGVDLVLLKEAARA